MRHEVPRPRTQRNRARPHLGWWVALLVAALAYLLTTRTTSERAPSALANRAPGSAARVPQTATPASSAQPPTAPGFHVQEVARGFAQPLLVTHAGDGSYRRFVVEQTGKIWVLQGDGSRSETPFLDVGAKLLSSKGERGLLGLAFHPRFRENGRFFVAYTAKPDGAHVTEAYRVTPPSAAAADPASARIVLRIAQPAGNHNGGHLAFGPDGYLYIGTGDGGGAGDTYQTSRRPDSLLAKMLRIDVDTPEMADAPYAIPSDNPFVEKPGYRPEIWATGLRNPWRYSFDRTTGDLYIADVGQNRFEEVHFQSAGARGGADYGWNIMEGAACFRSTECDQTALEQPIFTYTHDEGCSITGGYVYRGQAIASLFGTYVFGDFCSGRIWGSKRSASGRFSTRLLVDTAFAISSFGEDEAGELYLTDLGQGVVYQLVADEPAAQPPVPAP